MAAEANTRRFAAVRGPMFVWSCRLAVCVI